MVRNGTAHIKRILGCLPMLAQNVGILLATGVAVLVAAVLNFLFRSTRIGLIGAPVVAAGLASGAAFLLQLLGAGDVRLLPTTGGIDWPPVISTVFVGASTGVLTAFAVALMRWGGRSAKRRAAEPPTQTPQAGGAP